MTPARRAVVAKMRASARFAKDGAAASFDHLADLLTHHERGYPNVVEKREVELKGAIRFPAPRKLTHSMSSALGRVTT